MQLLSMWKRCISGFLLEAGMLDPVTFVFTPAVSGAIARANQANTSFEWLHMYDLGLVGLLIDIFVFMLTSFLL